MVSVLKVRLRLSSDLSFELDVMLPCLLMMNEGNISFSYNSPF